MVGYAVLESPGNPFDGFDNDVDAESTPLGRTSPLFALSDFDSVLVTRGMKLVTIDDAFRRHLFTVPNTDSFKAWTRGMTDSIWLYPGKTKLVEGNFLPLQQIINPNAQDGIDNNFNGLIDENQFVHYEQVKKDRTGRTLFDVLRPLRHVDYIGGQQNDSNFVFYSMIDERRDDLKDNDRNWDARFDDVGVDGIGPSAVDYPGPDCGESDGRPTSGAPGSYCFDPDPRHNSRGEPHIDLTDVGESDQIGLTNFYYFTPAGKIVMADKDSLWSNLAPGFFDIPPSMYYDPSTHRSYPLNGEDGDFIYGSGYFPLLAKATERFSLALVYGGGKGGKGTPWDVEIADLLKNKKTVQKIYDANYQFPQPPTAPTVTAVAGDHQVTIYWDRVAESFVDPVLRVKSFEGYKVYRSTDPDFSDIFTITDANGSPRGYRPVAQFDLKDGVQGYFRATGDIYNDAAGFSYYLGGESGLEHTYVDHDVDNGRRYYYAVVAYSKGDEDLGVYPAENTKSIRLSSTGEIDSKDINVITVVPNAPAAGYARPPEGVRVSHATGPGSGNVSYSIVDETKLTDHRYQLEFLDTQVDGIDNNANGLIDAADSTEWNRITSSYSVRDLEDIHASFTSLDTINVSLPQRNLIPGSVSVLQQDIVVDPSRYILDPVRGTIRSSAPGNLPQGEYSIKFQYYPVYNSPNLQGTPFLVENTEADNFDGIQLKFSNIWLVKPDTASWIGSHQGSNTYKFFFSQSFPQTFPRISGYRKPSDYELRFSANDVDTSMPGPIPFDSPVPVNFRIYNRTDSTFIKFLFLPATYYGRISGNSELIFMEKNPRGVYSATWDLFFVSPDTSDRLINYTDGDMLILRTLKSFRRGDVFTFQTAPSHIDNAQAKSTLDNVKVVPNPYVTASSFEPPLNPGITSGRGTRKIDFIHLPANSRINIYTSRGDHIASLRHDGNIEDGTVSWNLKTEENLDVAFGIYFYVVESSVGTKTGKIAIIK